MVKMDVDELIALVSKAREANSNALHPEHVTLKSTVASLTKELARAKEQIALLGIQRNSAEEIAENTLRLLKQTMHEIYKLSGGRTKEGHRVRQYILSKGPLP